MTPIIAEPAPETPVIALPDKMVLVMFWLTMSLFVVCTLVDVVRHLF